MARAEGDAGKLDRRTSWRGRQAPACPDASVDVATVAFGVRNFGIWIAEKRAK